MDYETAMKGFVLDGRRGRVTGIGATPRFSRPLSSYWLVEWEDGRKGIIYCDSREFERMTTLEQARIAELEAQNAALREIARGLAEDVFRSSIWDRCGCCGNKWDYIENKINHEETCPVRRLEELV